MTKLIVEFDPDSIRVCMDLWRQTVDLELEMLDEFKVHMMANRKPILENYVRAAGTWMSLLGGMKPVGAASEAEFASLGAQVTEFVAWAESELQALDDLAAEG